MLERDDELRLLRDRLAAAVRGHGGVVLVSGDAGVGKTALVQAFSEGVRGARLLRGACDPLVTPRPLGPLLDIIDRLGGALPELDPSASREALFRGFLAELSSRSHGSVAVIEDAHWADEATLDLLRYLARRIGDLPALLLVTYRANEVGTDHALSLLAGDLAGGRFVRHVALEPLSRTAVAQLARDAGTDWDVDELYRQTAGNAFFVTEALAAGTGRVPGTVRDAVLARTARLEPPARAAAEAAAVAPRAIEHWMLEALADVTAADVDACVAAGVLAPDLPGTVGFRHELARRVIDEALPPARRASLHSRVVDLLLAPERGADPARIAHHAEHAGRADVAFEHAIMAARRAEALESQREAADHYDRALRHRAGQSDQDIAEALEAAAQAASAADRVPMALAAADEAVGLRRRLGEPLRLATAMLTRARALWMSGRAREAYEQALAAVELLEELPAGRELADAYSNVASNKMLAGDFAGAAAWGSKAIRLAEQVGAPLPLTRALGAVGVARTISGDLDGLDDLRRAIAVAEAGGVHPFVAVGVWINLGSAAGEVRRYDVADDAFRRGVAAAAQHDLDALAHYGAAWQARIRLERGEWQEAERLAAALPIDRGGTSVMTTILGLVVIGRIAVRTGDTARARPLLERAWDLARKTGDLYRLWPVAAARAEAAWLAGEGQTVLDAVGETYEQACELGHAWAAGELGLWRWRAGADDPLSEWAAAPFQLQVAGAWRDAAASWRALGCPYEEATALADSGDPGALLQALTILDRLAARPAGDRVRRRLRALGVRGVPRGPRASTVAHPLGLTQRQAEVLELMARGRSDADIARTLSISTRTANHHVSAVLAALGVTSRTEAARRAHELALLEPDET